MVIQGMMVKMETPEKHLRGLLTGLAYAFTVECE